ncbi:MAG: CsiV family protein [Woeseiaceae bacterium]|nr:CsiV family protein [Woeseiaceae bacterium]
MKKRTSLLVLSLLASAVFGQDLLSQEEKAPVRRYTTEIIIFSYAQDVSEDTEVFIPDAPPLEDLLGEPMLVDGDSLQCIPEIVEDHELEDYELEDYELEDYELEDYELEDEPFGPVMLAEENFQLKDEFERLDNLEEYTPLLHFGWTQAAHPDDEQEVQPLSSLVTPPDGLEGNLTLYLSRYLHLAVNLQLDVPIKEMPCSYGNDNFEEITPKTYPVRYRIEEDRIFRIGELRYFDHPKFGVLARIIRAEEVEPAEDEIAEELTLQAPGKTIELSPNDWEKVDDPTNLARNYSEKTLSLVHQFNRMVTVYLSPMSNDQRIGQEYSSTEYVEIFISIPGFVTVQTRTDKGRYWVLSRETFKPKEFSPVNLSSSKLFLSESEKNLLLLTYQLEIDGTRLLLNSKF